MILKQNDTGIGFRAHIWSDNTIHSDIDLDRASVVFKMNEHEITPIIEDNSGVLIIPLNRVHTSKVGFYNCEIKVTFPDGRRETYPNDGYMKIRIIEEV